MASGAAAPISPPGEACALNVDIENRVGLEIELDASLMNNSAPTISNRLASRPDTKVVGAAVNVGQRDVGGLDMDRGRGVLEDRRMNVGQRYRRRIVDGGHRQIERQHGWRLAAILVAVFDADLERRGQRLAAVMMEADQPRGQLLPGEAC